MKSFGDVKAALLRPVRRGGTRVLIPSDSFGVGNLLYYWMQASTRSLRGDTSRVRWTDRMQPWQAWFPHVFEQLVINRSDVSFFSPREFGPVYQEVGSDFSLTDLTAFIDTYVLRAESPFLQLVKAARPGADVTINVRRGDYYSVPKFRGRYSFDIPAYVGVALAEARRLRPVDSVLMVSDDPEWCRIKLDWLNREASVRYLDGSTPAPEQLAMLAASPRLILTNSTFSYWGAYVSNRVHGDNHVDVYAPWFHSREWRGGAATQLDPRWTSIGEIPGGWDA